MPVALVLVGFLVVIAFVAGLIREAFTDAGQAQSLVEGIWQSILHVLDVGSLATDKDWSRRVLGLSLVLLGIFGTAVLVAAVISSFQTAIERVRHSNAPLERKPDIVVLGWSEQIVRLFEEFATGTSSRRRLNIALLSSQPRPTATDELHKRLTSKALDRLRIEVRSGNRIDSDELALLRVREAPRLVILSEPEATDDSAVVTTVFALMHAGVDLDRQVVVAEVCGHDAIVAIHAATANRVIAVSSNEILSLILAQAVRHRGMGQVFAELTSYEGAEIYFQDVPDHLLGESFGSLVAACKTGVPIGLIIDQRARLLPNLSTILSLNTRVIVLAETEADPIYESVSLPVELAEPREPVWDAERLLVVGWNDVFARALTLLRRFLASGSHVTVLVSEYVLGPLESRSLEESDLVDEIHMGRSGSELLELLNWQLSSSSFDAVVVLPQRELCSTQQADADTLVALAASQSLYVNQPDSISRPRLLAELRDSRTEQLAAVVGPDDLILSDAITASLLAQLVNNPKLDGVLADLFDFKGSATFIRPIKKLISKSISFQELVLQGMTTGEIVIGVRRNGHIDLAPPRDSQYQPDELDGLVVLGAGEDWSSGKEVNRVADLVLAAREKPDFIPVTD